MSVWPVKSHIRTPRRTRDHRNSARLAPDIRRSSSAPTGIDLTRLSAEDLEEVPILAELKRHRTRKTAENVDRGPRLRNSARAVRTNGRCG
jgi:hypothetical protein